MTDTTTQDRELLELAAKAYWGNEIDDVCSIEWSESDWAIAYTHADNQDHNGCDQAIIWNPLKDAGAALRLAAKLEITLHHFKNSCAATSRVRFFCEDHGDDPLAASLRAIVRAAAAIGAQLP